MAKDTKRAGGGRGNAPRQGPPTPAPKPPAQPVDEQGARARMHSLFELVRQRRPEIEAVLPPDIPYEKFEAVLNMAIRREPRLLYCYAPSLIKAAIQSAYDGLLPDGNQAVILVSNNKVPGTGQGNVPAQYRDEARYQSMVYGLRLQLVQAGAVTFIDGIVVYKNDHFDFERGLNERLDHKPAPLDQDPGEPIGAYARAILPSGTVVFDVLRKPEIMKARDVAKTKNVWDGPFGMEMWKKTAIRRLRKAIPTSRPIRDAEELEMFSELRQPSAGALPPPRPRREDFQPRLEHDVEVGLDLSGFDGREEERVDAGRTEERRDEAREQRSSEDSGEGGKKSAGAGQEARGEADPAAEEAAVDDIPASDDRHESQAIVMPDTPAKWREWADILIAGLERLPNADVVNDHWEDQREFIAAAPEDIRTEVNGAFSERLSDIATGEPS